MVKLEENLKKREKNSSSSDLTNIFFCACSVKVYNIKIWWIHVKRDIYSKTLNNEYIERIDQMSYSSLSGNGDFCRFLVF